MLIGLACGGDADAAVTDSCRVSSNGLSLGDSISTVPGWTTSFPHIYAASTNHSTIAKHAVGGYVTSEILLQWTAKRTIPNLDLVIVNGGTNNCYPASSPGDASARATAALADLQTIFTQASGDGLRVISVNVPPAGTYSGWTSNSEACRDAINAGLLTATGISCRLDADAVLRDPGNPDNLLPAYDSGDGVHQNAAGSQAVATQLAITCGAY